MQENQSSSHQQIRHQFNLQREEVRNNNQGFNLIDENKNHLKKDIERSQKQMTVLIFRNNLQQAEKVCEQIEQLVKEYYKISPSVIKDMKKIKNLHRMKKSKELLLLQNKAMIYNKGNKGQKAQEVLLLVIDEIQQLILGQNIRLNLLESEQIADKQIAMNIISRYKVQLAKLYYLYAIVTQQQKLHELSVTSLLKTVQIIQQMLKNSLLKDGMDLNNKQLFENRVLSDRLLTDRQQLYLICLFIQGIVYGKYLNTVILNDLANIMYAFMDEHQKNQSDRKYIHPYFNQPNTHPFTFKQWVHIQLDPLQNISQSYTIQDLPLSQFKQIIFLCCRLLSNLMNEQSPNIEDNQYQKSKQLKKIISIHICQAFIYEKLIDNKQCFQSEIEELYSLYVSKGTQNIKYDVKSLKAIIEEFGITFGDLHGENDTQVSSLFSFIHSYEEKKKLLPIQQRKKKLQKNAENKILSKKKISPQKLKENPTKHANKLKQQKNSKRKSQSPYSVRKQNEFKGSLEAKKKSKGKCEKFCNIKVEEAAKTTTNQLKIREKVKEEYLIKKANKPLKNNRYLQKAIKTRLLSQSSSISKEKIISFNHRKMRTETEVNKQQNIKKTMSPSIKNSTFMALIKCHK